MCSCLHAGEFAVDLLHGTVEAPPAKFHARMCVRRDDDGLFEGRLRIGTPLAFPAETASVHFDVAIPAAVLALTVPIAAARFRGVIVARDLMRAASPFLVRAAIRIPSVCRCCSRQQKRAEYCRLDAQSIHDIARSPAAPAIEPSRVIRSVRPSSGCVIGTPYRTGARTRGITTMTRPWSNPAPDQRRTI